MKAIIYCFLFTCGILECTARASCVGYHLNDIHSALCSQSQDDEKLPVTLYYEALCPFCREFVTGNFEQSMLRLNRLASAELTLVPYGNAKKSSEGTITCQHGLNECELNAWHACILEHLGIRDSLELITCMMRSGKNQLDKCASRKQIDVTTVKQCKQSRSVDEILAKYAEASKKVHYRGVPAITIDNVYEEDEQKNITDNFDDVFCAKYKAKFNKTLLNC